MTPTPAVVELHPDVSRAANLGESLTTAVTVTLPDPARLPRRPVVCFAWPGGGYSRRYFTFDVPGSAGGGQAGWHATRGWIFVSCDHVAVGDSDAPADPKRLTFENLAASNRATVDTVLARLAAGTLVAGFPPVVDAFTIGIGQSMGACLLIVQQAVHRTFDAIGVLGFSAIHTVLWMPPDARDLGTVSVERGSDVEIMQPPRRPSASRRPPTRSRAHNRTPHRFHYGARRLLAPNVEPRQHRIGTYERRRRSGDQSNLQALARRRVVRPSSDLGSGFIHDR